MLNGLIFSPVSIILLVLFASATVTHLRGQRKFSFLRQLFDHSTFMAPINVLMYMFSKAPNTAFLDLENFKALKIFEDNWEIIRDEALTLKTSQDIKTSDKYNDIGFNSFFRMGWKRFYIKWYSKNFHPSAIDKCPKTIELVRKTPMIKAAMFVVLPAGSELLPHRDPFAGSMRYHLGLETPNSDKCFINVDDIKYSWRDGKAVLFDETYIHDAENFTDQDRLIFFCDVRRPMRNKLGDWLNNFFAWFILAAAKSPNESSDGTGGLNKSFKYIYQFRLLGKRVKEKNETLYQFIKYLIFVVVLSLLVYISL